MQRPFSHRNLALCLLSIFCVGLWVFLAAPWVDIEVTRLFYRADAGFPLEANPELGALRMAMWRASLLFTAIAMVGTGVGLIWRGNLAGIPRQLWMMIFALFLLGPGLIVNVILKAHSGRARPLHIAEFGGDMAFSPAWVFSDQCVKNCSFVSGEGAGAAALVISGVLILNFLRPRIGTVGIMAGSFALASLGILTAAQRIVTGRHFLSDTVFAVVIVLSLALLLHRAMVYRRV